MPNESKTAMLLLCADNQARMSIALDALRVGFPAEFETRRVELVIELSVLLTDVNTYQKGLWSEQQQGE